MVLVVDDVGDLAVVAVAVDEDVMKDVTDVGWIADAGLVPS